MTGPATGAPTRKRIAFVLTEPMSVRAFMVGHISALARHYDITVYVNLAVDPCKDVLPPGVRLVHVGFVRAIDLRADLRTLWALYLLLRRERFDAIHSLMPKAGLLAMIAGFGARIPLRLHWFCGQVWVRKQGPMRWLLKSLDKLVVLLSTHTLTDSPSQRRFLIAEGILQDTIVLGSGSVAGVDLLEFRPCDQSRAAMRRELGYATDDVVLGFLGRLTVDKGVADLVEGFAAAKLPCTTKLLLVGPDEDGLVDGLRKRHGDLGGRLKFSVGFTDRLYLHLNAFDVFCAPSYREGFGLVVIQAAACGVPAVASRIYGLTDAVDEGHTGLMHAAGDPAQIAEALSKIAQDAPLRRRLGQNALARAGAVFSSERIVGEMLALYQRLLETPAAPRRATKPS